MSTRLPPDVVFSDHGADKLELRYVAHAVWPVEFKVHTSDGGTTLRIDMSRHEFRAWVEQVREWVAGWPDDD